ncbi:sarcosine oxidase subunit alpha [Rhodobium orientis]|uniref:Sarcosine oxidase subunit alpha n=1 Tax=Rhodobium orientis TaxID=34017 RepID=A0A327JQY2_9HYPH|nr:sarcosine oxidase subunit alpha family protein [Rhodobium orientis]MBB4302409.1 sarcosine oxidase subunit alpha [Rhodobium orientis]MBK5949260.1 sarcosine oxidase subunit alpha [Rhodobium orientis]RAI28687.1 sarcosine oxidase subunit alpha [Rhodobium orientis]
MTKRLPGGLIDRSKPLTFSFNGRTMQGFAGDTLASALLANGQRLVARSFKYHRPRGIFSAGSEEPNALMTIGSGAFQEPNVRATVAELYEGLEAKSQNHRGPLSFDLMAVTDLLSPFLSAGFYYKTFMWPASFWEKFYEPVIRESAGLGELATTPDPSTYDKGFLHADVLVIGAGPAGLSAALAAGRAGARVILCDEDFIAGGRLNGEAHEVDGMPGAEWAEATIRELSELPNVRVLTRTTVFGVFDHGIFGALTRNTDHLAPGADGPRQTLWRITAKRAVLAAGATERPIAFAGNDRPGVMLAGSVRTYANRFAAAPGARIAVFTNNDDGWRTARDLTAKGVEVTALIDSRAVGERKAPGGIPLLTGTVVTGTSGRLGLASVTLSSGERIAADCLAVSGGWNPNVALTCHQRGRPRWDDMLAAFLPGADLPLGMAVAGAANGALTFGAALSSGRAAGEAAAADLGFSPVDAPMPKTDDEPYAVSPLWHVEGKGKAFVDLQNDVAVKDVKLAHREGYRSVEHLKRYTTLGMATDQGKTANVLGLAILAECAGKTIPETGTTIFRPPYTPVPIGALAGASRGQAFRPVRKTPSHRWAEAHGASFVEVGPWLRAEWFALPDETHWRQSVDREVVGVRNSVGICDVTTLGKIDIQGRDAGIFLDRVYANIFSTFPVGKVRYGLMLREDGFAFDDSTTARLGEMHYVMTASTANAVAVFRHLEFCRQCLWPDLDVHLISTTDAWAQFAVAGPNARKLLEKIVDPEVDISNDAFPFMACAEITVCGGVDARLFRISFSGELAFEVAVPSRYGNSLFGTLIEAGREFGAVPYGTEALGVMRVEKGHAVGAEINGQTTARDLGLGRMVSAKKDCIGKALADRDHLMEPGRPQLVGFKPVDRAASLVAGAHFLKEGAEPTMANDEGWMTSVCHSPTLGHAIGLGFIAGGLKRLGETVRAVDLVGGSDVAVEIVSPHFVDPEGVRLRG